MKIHILGPSGSGTSTVGKMFAQKLKIPFFDSDDFFWEKTEVPYSEIRHRKNGRDRKVNNENNKILAWSGYFKD